jgi:hypothetical protein
VPERVRQRLLDHPVRRERHACGNILRLALERKLDYEPRSAHLADECLDVR